MEYPEVVVWSFFAVLGLLACVYHRWRSPWLTFMLVGFSFMLLACLLGLVACFSSAVAPPTDMPPGLARAVLCLAFGMVVVGLAGCLGHLGHKVNQLEDSLYAMGREETCGDALTPWKKPNERSHDIRQ
jgi:ABC-type transport system involved in multi-copper enzyme maturation permease subunit